MSTSALLMMIPTWSVIIFFTVYFMVKALKTQHSHDGEE